MLQYRKKDDRGGAQAILHGHSPHIVQATTGLMSYWQPGYELQVDG